MTFAPHQLQMSERSRAGHARGARYVQALVADYQLQDWMASRHAGFENLTLFTGRSCRGSGAFSRNSRSAHEFLPRLSRRPVRCFSLRIGHHLPGCAVMAAPGAFIHASGPDCTPPRANRLPHQQLVNPLVDRLHFPNVLSNSFASAGFNTSEATDGRAQNSSGAFQKRQGGYPHVGS